MLDNALDLPEIRIRIGTFLSLHDLTVCLRVSKNWLSTFTPLLWHELTVSVDTAFFSELQQQENGAAIQVDGYDTTYGVQDLELQRLYGSLAPHAHVVPLAPSLIQDNAHHIRSLTFEGSVVPEQCLSFGSHCTRLQKLCLIGPTIQSTMMCRQAGYQARRYRYSPWRAFQELVEDNRTTLRQIEFQMSLPGLRTTPSFLWSLVELCGHPRSHLERMSFLGWADMPLLDLLMIWKAAQSQVQKFELSRCEIVRGPLLEVYQTTTPEIFPPFWCMGNEDSDDTGDSIQDSFDDTGECKGDRGVSTRATTKELKSVVNREAELSKLRRRCWAFVNSSVTLHPEVMWEEESLQRFEQDETVDKDGRFTPEYTPKEGAVRDLTLDEVRGIGPDLTIRLFIAQAPKLQRLVWHLHRLTDFWMTANGGGLDITSTAMLLHPRFQDPATGRGIVGGQPCRRWPHLESVTITSARGTGGISDIVLELLLKNIGQESIATCSPLRILRLQGVGFGPKAFNSLRYQEHFQALVEVDLLRCVDVTSTMLEEILESCPKLEAITGNVIRVEDIALGLPWACRGLKLWRIHIDSTQSAHENREESAGTTSGSKAQQQVVFGRLSTLVDLETLDLDLVFPIRERGQLVQTLEWQLKRGLNLLTTLKGLRKVRFLQTHSMNMSKSAVQWMMDHWPCLKSVEGRLGRTKADHKELARLLSYIMPLPNADLIKLPQEILDMIVPRLTRHDLTKVTLVSSSWFEFFSPYLWETVEIRDDKTMRRFVDSVEEGALIRNGHHIQTLDCAYYSVVEHIAKLGRTCTNLLKLSVESNLSSSTFGKPRYFSTGSLSEQDPGDGSTWPLFGASSEPSMFAAMSPPPPLFAGVPPPGLSLELRLTGPAAETVPPMSTQNTVLDTASALVSTFESLGLSSGTQSETRPETQPEETPPETSTASPASAMAPLFNFGTFTPATSTSELPVQTTANPGAMTSTASTVRFGQPAFSSITSGIPGANFQSAPQHSVPSTTLPSAGSQPAPFTFGQITPQSSGSLTTLQAAAPQPAPFTFDQPSPQAPVQSPFTFGTFPRSYNASSFGTNSTSQEYTPPAKVPPSCHDRSYLALVLQRNKKLRSLTVRGSLVSRVYVRHSGSTEVCMDRIFESLPESIVSLVISRPSNPFTDPFMDDDSSYGSDAPIPMSIGPLPHLKFLHVDSALNTQSLQEILTKCGSLERLGLRTRAGFNLSVIARALKENCPLLCEFDILGPCPPFVEKDWIELLKASVSGWRTLSFHSVPFTSQMLDTILESATTLENLLIDTMLIPASKDIQKLLCSAPKLKRLCLLPGGKSLYFMLTFLEAEDMMKSKWACCDTLESLKLAIKKIPRPDLVNRTNGRPFTEAEKDAHRRNFPTISERTVYDQLRNLKNLRELVLGFEEKENVQNYEQYNSERIAEGIYYDRNHSQHKVQYDCLGMSLETGLDLLKDLKEMRYLGLDKMAVNFDRAEEQAWVKSNWPKFGQCVDDFWETRGKMP